ncbi:MAG: alcohol dehydrogenase catalytic domain-containing protein, partial [Acidobacteriota bacterium]
MESVVANGRRPAKRTLPAELSCRARRSSGRGCCGLCEFCRRGEQSLCVRFGVLGEHNDGTFAEAVVVAAD